VLNEGKIAAKGAPLEVLARPGYSAGFDNILRLEIVRHERDKGISWLELGSGQELAAPLTERPLGSRASVGIFADEIILCLEKPKGLSARNVLAAMVRSTLESGPDTIVNLKVGQAHTLLAHVTHAAATELNLTQGREVFAIIKTSGCVLL
jgi:molybdate transport system ATP-binding protein